MAGAFDEFIAEEVKGYKGICVPVKAGILRRAIIRWAPLGKLLPDPDDEAVIASWGRQFGFHTYLLNAQDDDGKEKIIACADRIRRMEHPESY